MANAPTPNESLTTIRFHFFSIKFTPLVNVTLSSNDILLKVITFISNELHNKKGYLIDRYHKRSDNDKREIFMNTAIIMAKEKRIRCSMALLRSGVQPLLKPADSFELVPLDKANGSIVEQTNFFIDYSKTPAIVCVQFNNEGPRMSDIEYYFRNISSKQLNLSRACDVKLKMNNTIDKTLSDLVNVLNFEFKLQPQKIAQLDDELKGYISGINNIGNLLKPKAIRVEAFFRSTSKVKSNELNKEANGMVRNFLKKFKGRTFNIEAFEDFEVTYENKEGQEEFFSLLKSKKEVVKDVDLVAMRNTRQWYELIEDDLNEFMSHQ